MRLSAEQVKKAILHSDQDVRKAAVFYFSRSFSHDKDLMPLAIQAIEQHGWQDAFSIYSFLDHLVQSNDTFQWLIEELNRIGLPETDDYDDPLHLYRQHLTSTLVNAEVGFLRQHENKINQIEALRLDERETIEQRIYFASLPPDSLWAKLEEFCERNTDNEEATDDELACVDQILEALARHPDFCADRVLSVLSEEVKVYEGNPMQWMETFMIRLAGEMKLEGSIPHIIRRFDEDYFWDNEECYWALVRIGSDAVVGALADEFPSAGDDFRLTAASALEDIHSDLSVEKGMEFYAREKDEEIKHSLLRSVLMNFSDEAVEPARQMIRSCTLDPDLIGLRSDLLVTCTMMNIRFPEYDQWKEDSKHDREFRKKWYADHYLIEDDSDNEYLDEVEEDIFSEPVTSPGTIVHRERVRRNDLCPCGSGKKFKKCCMKSGRF